MSHTIASYVVPLEESARRRPEFHAGSPVRLRDGAVWYLRVPAVVTVPKVGDGGHPYIGLAYDFGDAFASDDPGLAARHARSFEDLLDAFGRSDRNTAIWGGTVFRLTTLALRANYYLVDDDVAALLLAGDDDRQAAVTAMWSELGEAVITRPLEAYLAAARKLPYRGAAEYRAYAHDRN